MTALARTWHGIPSVSAKFILILMPILMATTFGFSTIFFVSKYDDLRAGLTDRVATIAEINAVALSSSLWAFDVPGTRNIIQAIAANRDLRCVDVADDLAGSRYLWPETGCAAPENGGTVSRDINVQNRRLGSVTLVYSFDSVGEQVRAEIINTVWLLLLVLAGTVVTALAAYRLTIGAPLNRLIASIQRAEGDHRARLVHWSSADELGRVISAYNAMLTRLSDEEVALRQSEERLALAITATRSAVWDLDLRTGAYWWSQQLPALLDYRPHELPINVRTWESLIHPDDLERVIDESSRHVRGEAATYCAIYRLRRKDGSWIWVEDRATAIRDPGGMAIRLTGTMSDVTERVRAADELARERNILQVTLDNVEQGIVMVDGQLRLVLSNQRAADLLNIPVEVLARLPSYPEIVRRQRESGEFSGDIDDPDLQDAGLRDSLDHPHTFKRRRPDGTVIEVRSNPLPGGGFVRTFTDITVEAQSAEEIFSAMQALEEAYADLKETQASLVQAEKMASLALLVAGVAHEINTPVGIAFGCATHLAAKTRDLAGAFESGRMKRSDLTAYVGVASEATRLIHQNLQRAAELIQSFKRVAVDQTSQERRTFDLGAYLTEVITSLGPEVRRNAHEITVECADGIAVDSFPGALSQVVTNLIMNAVVHAFDDRSNGRMTLRVGEIADDELEIRFADDGKGIPQENLPRIFEPFFTTRRGSGGSGLGLHIVFNLVTQTLGGRISVDSTPGRGTVFTIRIPRHPAGRVIPLPTPGVPAEDKGLRRA